MKIKVLDVEYINPGEPLWQKLAEFGELTLIDNTPYEVLADTIADAEIIFTSKCRITDEILDKCPNVRFIGELATGFDNIDIEACRRRNIAVYNIPGYSTDAVAQHTIALLLEAANKVAANSELSKEGKWFNRPGFDYSLAPLILLNGRSLGIVGYGNIGSKVAEIAQALGMKINIYSRDKKACIESDFVSLHCPAASDNYHMVDSSFISQMKEGAVLINTARGALIDENALLDALDSGRISMACLDVLEKEPPSDNPLIGHPKTFVTPHIAWAPKETRDKIILIAYDNLKSWINGKDSKNRLV